MLFLQVCLTGDENNILSNNFHLSEQSERKVPYACDLVLKVYPIICHVTPYLNDLHWECNFTSQFSNNMIVIYYMPVVKYKSLSDWVTDFKLSSDEILLYQINFKCIPLKRLKHYSQFHRISSARKVSAFKHMSGQGCRRGRLPITFSLL